MEKFKKLLEHWIEHNEEHIETYKKWANDIKGNASELLKEAVKKFEEGNEILKRIYEKLNE
ncbi:MAG: hypothetical protein QXM23_02690 [Archaeoglobaceae archaeon]|uniref:DUF8180 domain-containing protein n=1 Tax=Archaeoglobus fulgidus TaxID=2234 RepID=A0A7J3M2A4_ARCFL